MKNAIKIVLVNAFVLILLLLLADPLSFLFIHSYIGIKNILIATGPGKQRAELPPFKDKERSRVIMSEFSELDTEYKPFVEWARLPFMGAETTIDKDGVRVTPLPPGSRDLRAAFFGGSTMWGTGAGDDGTIPAQFAKLNPSYQVFNYGESGYNSRQALDRLITLLSRGESYDLVVFYDGVNDVASHCRQEISIPGHEREVEIRQTMKAARDAESWKHFFVHLRRLAEIAKRKIWPTIATPTGFSCSTDADRAQQTARVLVNNWLIARDIVERRGGRFMAVLQPVAFLSETDTGYLQLPEGQRPEYQTVYPLIREEMAHARIGHDLSSVFDGSAPLYIDECHVTEEGNLLMAKALGNLPHEERGKGPRGTRNADASAH